MERQRWILVLSWTTESIEDLNDLWKSAKEGSDRSS